MLYLSVGRPGLSQPAVNCVNSLGRGRFIETTLSLRCIVKKLLPLILIAGVILLVSGIESIGLRMLDAHPRAASPASPDGTPAVLVGAGDIADCHEIEGAKATAALLANIPGTIFAAGDTGCPDGTVENFTQCYDPTWGRFKDRTRPAPGNHEYHTKGALPYFQYFGAAAGEPGKAYYSYELGGWHIISLDSDCSDIGGCGAGSREEQWLRQDLASHPSKCTVAYWHHPLFSSGQHGNSFEMRAFWQDLYHAGATIVINGHDHDYERFAPQDPDGHLDRAKGIREFVAGTGGRHRRHFGAIIPNSEVHDADSFGVLKLTLYPDHYTWQFIPAPPATFNDSGEGTCHGSS